MKSVGSELRSSLLQVILGVGNGPRYLQLPLVLCSVNRGIANVNPCSNITQSSPDFYNPSKEKMSKAQVKLLEHLAGLWSLSVGNLPDLEYTRTNTCQVLLGFSEATVPG